MKKYIRTKDNELYKYVTDFDEYIIATKNGIYSESIKKDNILDQADTIEELCDEFVFEGVDEKPFVCDNFSELIYWFNHSKEQQYKIRNCYGAIWVDKGLFYVSKINDKGEFELL